MVMQNADWDVERAVGLDEMDRIGANSRLLDFQNSCFANKRKDLRTAAKAFDPETDCFNPKGPADAGPCSELVSMKCIPVNALTKTKMAKDKSVFHMQKHDKLEDKLPKGFQKVHGNRKVKVAA